MSQVSRATTFTASTVIQPGVHNTEHDTFVNGINDNDTRITNLETANMSISGIKTLTDVWKFISGLWTDTIYERTSGAGVTLDPSSNNGVKLKDGVVYLGDVADQTAEDALSLADGAIWHRSDLDVLKTRLGGSTKTIFTGSLGNLPDDYINPRYAPSWNSASSITLPEGMAVKDSTNQYDIVVSATITLSLANSGVNGRDSGAETSNTWYFPYLIKNTATEEVAAVFSTVNESVSGSITLPTGYDVKRQLPLAVRNDGSSNIMKFHVLNFGPNTLVLYEAWFGTAVVGRAGTTSVFSGATSTTYTDVGLSDFVPPISTKALLKLHASPSANRTFNIRANGESHDGYEMFVAGGNQAYVDHIQPTDSSQLVELKTDASTSMDIEVLGYYVGGL